MTKVLRWIRHTIGMARNTLSRHVVLGLRCDLPNNKLLKTSTTKVGNNSIHNAGQENGPTMAARDRI